VVAAVSDPPAQALDGANPLPRGVQLALHAARLAWADAGWDGPHDRVAVVVGTGLGNLDVVEDAHLRLVNSQRLSAATGFRAFAHAAACEIACELDLRGPIQTVTSGCNSGADALGLALDWLRLGRADAVLVGGTEAELTAGFLGAMSAARALSRSHNDAPEEASRPFDIDRDGNVPGEGAGFLVVEHPDRARARHARVYARLSGFANQAVGKRPSYNPFAPPLDIAPMVRTMRAALDDSGITPEEVSTVSANGSSSVFYDPLEAAAIWALFGADTLCYPVHSIKSMLGQTGAVTPALQAISAALTIHHGLIPPTINIGRIEPRCALNVVQGQALRVEVRHLLANAIGFGGYYYAAAVYSAEPPGGISD